MKSPLPSSEYHFPFTRDAALNQNSTVCELNVVPLEALAPRTVAVSGSEIIDCTPLNPAESAEACVGLGVAANATPVVVLAK